MKTANLLLLITVFLISCGQGKEKKKAGDNGAPPPETAAYIVAGSSLLFPVMQQWVVEYKKTTPGIQFDLRSSNSGEGMASLKAGTADIAMCSRPLTDEETAAGFFALPVLLDIVLPVISFENPEIQDIVMYGLKKSGFAGVYSGKIKTWGGLDRTKSTSPITVFHRSDSSGSAAVWASFLGLSPGSMSGKTVAGEAGMFSAVTAEPFALGYCSAYTAYDIRTGMRKPGIYIVPVDFNDNGLSDDAELVYDKLSVLKKALQEKKLPSPPARHLYLVTRKAPDPALKAFYNWILTAGQNFADRSGYMILSRETAEKAISSLGQQTATKP
jgi:phosphate transport system substrate-binding protein